LTNDYLLKAFKNFILYFDICKGLRREEEKRLLKMSKDFLETAEYQIGKGFYDLAAFSLEQALQLF